MMRILVCVKWVLDTDGTIPVDTEANAILQAGLHWTVGPLDRLALEEAARMKEAGICGHITALCLGPAAAADALRVALASGADRAIHICDPDLEPSDSCATGIVLAKAIAALGLEYDLILCGARAADTNAGLAGPAIAAELHLPLITEVDKIEVSGQNRAIVRKKLEAGDKAVVEVPLPALLTVETGINRPKYLKLRAKLLAARHQIETYDLRALGLTPGDATLAPRTKVIAVGPPRPRGKKLFTPDSSLSAAERMRQLMSGGATQKASSGLLEGDPKTLATKCVQFLKEKQLLPEPPSGGH
jgi:electron transfer flavoprotein beta subunit